MSPYGALGQHRNANKAREEAEATLSRVSGAKQWATLGVNAVQTSNRYIAELLSRQGNYPEAEDFLSIRLLRRILRFQAPQAMAPQFLRPHLAYAPPSRKL